MTKNKKMPATKRGFTLVEVIVVAAIVLILSAVAIPMYNGFVRQARQDAVDNLAETAAAALNSYWRKVGDASLPAVNSMNDAFFTSTLKVHYNGDKHTISVTGTNVKVCEKKDGTATDFCSDNVAFKQ